MHTTAASVPRRLLTPLLAASRGGDKEDGGRSSLTRSSSRRFALARWVGGMGLLGLALANLQTTLGANAAAVSDVQQQQQQQQGATAAVESGMGLDLSPMPLSEAMKAAEKGGVGKFGQRVLFEAATELPGSGVTANGYKYSTKVRGCW